ncbi:MAG: phytanoyl-CoA dioxygenase family protein [Caldilineaceae bacterium]|nr:phytanoyl-CoA dioxygenase family protein [Caldilineaceae bacterium]
MTPEEKFMFDLEGYIVIKNVLTPEEVAALNALADQRFTEKREQADRRQSAVSQWGPEAQALIDHPKIVPYMLELLGPKFRIDHDYCIFMTKGGRAGGLHGGEGHSDGEADHWYRYRDGVMRNGLTVVTFFLTHADQGDGGFACVPGSHKSNFAKNLPDDVRKFARVPHYVTQPAVAAGDALIFTEALIHGTMPWAADHERRALLYKFSPGHSSWANTYYNPADYPTATEQQIRIMAAPSVGRRPDSIAAG